MSSTSDDPWELTRHLSPRGSVRVDAEGSNDYWLTHCVDEDAPTTPWAMNLAGADGRYRYVCFDLDAKNGNAAYDASRLSYWLDELNVPHLVCISGPTGGRHVWIAVDDAGADAELVATIAHLAAQLLPSLDVNPLVNPATGCVRPPYTPHRRGGRSEPQGDVAVLEHQVDVDQLLELRTFLVDAGASIAPAPVSLVKGMAHDGAGHPHLVGAKRDVSARIRELINAAPDDDTSRTLAAVLVGCARARWRYTDVQAIAEHSPALEHARSRPGAAGARHPRTIHDSEKTLAAEWSRAVFFAAQNPPEFDVEDPEFVARAIAVSRAVGACQSLADTNPGRWGLDGASRAQRGAQGRPSHRAVLDAVCLYLVQAARADVEVDTRRLSADTGYGREACRLALAALTAPDVEDDAESAWLVRVEDAHGIHGARFRLSERFSTEAGEPEWAQAAMRPAPTAAPAAALRTWWINTLSSHLQALAHDVFAAPGSLGRTAGRAYAHLPEEGTAEPEQVQQTAGLTRPQLQRALRRLHRAGLATRTPAGWARPEPDARTAAAVELGVDGFLLERAWRYDLERARWTAWCDEVTWLKRRRKPRRGSRHGRGPGDVALFGSARPRRRYARTPDGRPDHRAELALAATRVDLPAEQSWRTRPWTAAHLASDTLNEIRAAATEPDRVPATVS
ncbi:helix-turn-helix domain-containing protein [Agromyces sp. S2-1-8]|uniref:helix-turn-helix domain-containing protein n=1 Tax=Agromyces sp. S2-1-8 TaxID=2897180 RepID=UPI001E508A70|nr:helix-turn-helix domain-containing protein [Agromyces sp. S2-1-8]MCD5348431.1 helix-turn-helix domain-containing protein [Agromyces sp. S2-1-8]